MFFLASLVLCYYMIDCIKNRLIIRYPNIKVHRYFIEDAFTFNGVGTIVEGNNNAEKYITLSTVLLSLL